MLLGFLIAGPSVLEGARAASSGFGFQGRYLIPVAVGLPLVATLGGHQISKRAIIHKSLPILVVLAHLIALNHVAKRFVVGLSGQSFWLTEIKWSGVGGNPAILISFTSAVALGIGFIICQLRNTNTDTTSMIS